MTKEPTGDHQVFINKALETGLNVDKSIERGKDTSRKLIPLSLRASAALAR